MTEEQKTRFKELNEKHPDCLKLFRFGDFYASYQEDAEETARITGVTVTADNEGDKTAEFPHYALDTYLPKLIRAGHRVAICDML